MEFFAGVWGSVNHNDSDAEFSTNLQMFETGSLGCLKLLISYLMILCIYHGNPFTGCFTWVLGSVVARWGYGATDYLIIFRTLQPGFSNSTK